MLKNIASIEASREVILNAPLVPLFEKQFRDEALLRTVHHGTHIEGNPLTRNEVKDALSGKPISARDRDIQEVINYRNVLRFIDGFQKPSIDESDILKIHQCTTEHVLPKEECGVIRTSFVVVKNNRTGEVSFRPPPPNAVKEQLDAFLSFLNSADGRSVHPVLRAGITHYELARIHPFVDGNGRTARAVATLVLFHEGYDIKKFFSIEEYFDRDASRYYRVLQEVSNQRLDGSGNRDFTPWLVYFTEGLAIELDRIKGRVQRLSLDTRLKGRTGQVALSERQMQIVEYIEDHGSISNKQWRELFPRISDDTILRDLKDLFEKRIIKKKGTTKAAVYLFM